MFLTADKTDKPDILHRIPIWLLLFYTSCIIPVAIFFRAEYCRYKYDDNPVLGRQHALLLILTVCLLFALCLLVYKLSDRLVQLKRRQVIGMILTLSVFMQLSVILLIPSLPFADQKEVNQIALDLIKGDFSAFHKYGYLYKYPNNTGITLFLSLLYRFFPDTILVPKLINILCSTMTAYLVFRIYEESRASTRNSYGILIFSAVFPPMLFMNNLVYNDVLATLLFVALLLQVMRFTETGKWCHLISASLLLSAGNFIRQVGVLFLIAAVLYLIMRRISWIKLLIFASIAFLALQLPLYLVNGFLLKTDRISEPVGKNSVPVHMWVHVGMNEEKFGYWDDAKTIGVYTGEGSWNKAKSAEIYTDMIRQEIREKGFLKIGRVYLKKNFWLWTEGTYQSEYYGIATNKISGFLYDTPLSRFLENSPVTRDVIRWLMYSFNQLLFILIWIGLISSIKSRYSYPQILSVIIVLGFIAFYTIWEIKPRYIYIAYPYLLLMACHGMPLALSKVTALIRRPGCHPD